MQRFSVGSNAYFALFVLLPDTFGPSPEINHPNPLLFMRLSVRTLAALGLTAVLLAGLAAPVLPEKALPEKIVVAAFSEALPGQPLPEGFETLSLDDDGPPTEYTVVRADRLGGTPVVKAVARNAATGLVKRRRIDLSEYPVLEWSWKVEHVLEQGDATKKSGDDYPARIYVTFDYDPSKLGFFDKIKYRSLRTMGYDDVPLRALNYVWASQTPVGKIVPNPYTDWVMTVPVESGCAHCGEWRTARRNVRADYRAAFGEEPPPVSGVAILTDTDNTGETATAYYGDIQFVEDE
jgi:hypothetical protein